MKLLLALTSLLLTTQVHGGSSATFQEAVVEPAVHGHRELWNWPPGPQNLECGPGASEYLLQVDFGCFPASFDIYYNYVPWFLSFFGKNCIPAPIETVTDFNNVQTLVTGWETCWVGGWEVENNPSGRRGTVPDTNDDWLTTTGGSLHGLPLVIPPGPTNNPPFVYFDNYPQGRNQAAAMTYSGMLDYRVDWTYLSCGIYLCCDEVCNPEEPCTNPDTGESLEDGEICVTDECLVGCCVRGECKLPDPLDPATDVCSKPKCALEAGYDCATQPDRPDECATYACLYNDPDFDYTVGPFADGCVAKLNDAECDDYDADDCQTQICSPVTLECADVNVLQGTLCKTDDTSEPGCCLYDGTCETDETVCSYAVPCLDANGNPITYPEEPDVDYTPGNLVTDYTTPSLETVPPPAPIKLTFSSNAGSLGSATSFAAIIYESPNCDGDILGVAGDPHYPSDYPPSYVSPHNGILDSDITGDLAAPVLEIPALPATFYDPHYYQDYACVGEDGEPHGRCGKLKFCVEFQLLDACDRKVDFVDVRVHIEFDLIETCEEDFCGEVILQRNEIVEDGADVELGEIKCFPCGADATSFPANGLPSVIVGQGSAVDICIDVVPNIDGVCVYDILNLQLEVTRTSGYTVNFPILPQGLSLVAYGGGRSNPDYEPLSTDYPTYGINENDATVKFLVPGEELQEVNPREPDGSCENPPCAVAARIRGKVLLGLGCYCKDPKSAIDCSQPIRDRRRLQDNEGEVGAADFVVPMELTVAGDNKEKEECTGFFLFCWIKAILDWILGLFSFGLL